MVWLKDLEDKVLKNKILKAPGKLAIIRCLVEFEAQTILSTVENDYKNTYKEPEDVNLLIDYQVKAEILVKHTSDVQVRIYLGIGGAVDMKKVRVEHIMQEVMHCLKIKIFGNKRLGLQSYI